MLSGPNAGPASSGGSGRIEQSDLEGVGWLKGPRLQLEVTKTIQEKLSDILEAAKQSDRRGVVLSCQLPQQTTHLEHLQEQMGNL